MSKSWVLIEVEKVGGEETVKALAGTEDRKCINRALAAMKLFKDEAIKAGRHDQTIIRSTIVDNAEYNSAIDECLEPELENEIDRLLSLVKVEDESI